jgi:hypothetical protein
MPIGQASKHQYLSVRGGGVYHGGTNRDGGAVEESPSTNLLYLTLKGLGHQTD